MNRKYNSTSVLIKSPKLRFNGTPNRLSNLSSSKLGLGCMDNSEVHIAPILCNVKDVFTKSPLNIKTKQILDLTRNNSPGLVPASLHESHEDLNQSINAKIPFIINEIHELTLGPGAITQDNLKNDTVKSPSINMKEKSTPPCQDPKVSSEDLDEDIRLYLKSDCLENTSSDIPKKFSDSIKKFNTQQKEEYLESRKCIEQWVLSDQLRAQSQYALMDSENCDSLSVLEKNKTARQGILNDLKELKLKMAKEKDSEERIKEKQKEQMAISKLVTESCKQFKLKEEKFRNNLKSSSDIARFQREGDDLITFNNKVCTVLHQLMNMCNQSSASIGREDISQLSQLMEESQSCFDRLNEIHDTIEAEAARARQANPVTPDTTPGPQVHDKSLEIIIDENSKKEEGDGNCLNTIIDPSSLKFYQTISENYCSIETQLESLLKDASLKSYRFLLMKAFNIPINAISGLDGKHTLEMYNRLVSVLRGDRVIDTGSGKTRVSQHPLGVLFCKYSMAKKFVAQVDVKPRVMFAYASVIVELWREFPDFGSLLLGAFFNQCPYLIPVFWPQLEGQSNEDYYKSLGYEYIENQVEKQDLFLRRMAAMVQLYAAITVTSVRSTAHHTHPHGLQYSWRWLSAMLNLEPQPDVSPTLLYSYLRIAGSRMATVYRQQFFKLIRFIHVHYLKKIKEVTPEDQSQQSIAILEEYIKNIVKTNQVAPPEGELPAKFW